MKCGIDCIGFLLGWLKWVEDEQFVERGKEFFGQDSGMRLDCMEFGER